jgi:serine/threonine protein kinase
VKIADFGLSMILSDLQKGAGKMKNVPLRWMAPETLSKAPVYSTASDVWSFGILVYEIFNKGVAPWAGERDFKLMAKKIRNYEMPKMPSNTPKVISKLVEEKIW